jgi:hypothetical protein
MNVDLARSLVLSGHFLHQEWPYEPGSKRVKFVKPLTALGRRVIVPDIIGFGLSKNPVCEQGANLTSLLRQLDVRDATMVCVTIGAARPVSALHSPSALS